ncbi:hypothetical protein CK934_22595 [Chitinophaga sp. MD30]|nr:hypothetical protein CK934_22595 [Chitinophaga sp. MD30]
MQQLAWAQVETQEEEDSVPVYVVDSVVAQPDVMKTIRPDQIAMLTVAKGSKAVEKYGSQAENGVIYIETKDFARQRYQRLFSNRAKEYAHLLKEKNSDIDVQYIVNDSLVTGQQESILAPVNDRNITSVTILTPKELLKTYKIKGKRLGLLVHYKE